MIDTRAPGTVEPPSEPKLSRPVRWIPVPPGSKPSICDLARAVFKSGQPSSCGAFIYFSEVNPKTGKRSPVSMKHPGAVIPTDGTWGQGLSHFADCPDAARFRKPR